MRQGNAGEDGSHGVDPITADHRVQEEKVLRNVEVRSQELFTRLRKLQQDSSLQICDVRGQGLMVAVEFGSGLPSKPSSSLRGLAAKISKQCADRGVLILATSVFEVIRFIPPLTISKEELSSGLDIFEGAVRDVLKNI